MADVLAMLGPAWLAALATMAGVGTLSTAIVLVGRLLARGTRRGTATVDAPTAPRRALRDGLAATRQRLLGPLDALLGRSATLDATLTELEEVLIAGDVGAASASALVAGIRQRVGRAADGAAIREALRAEIVTMLGATPPRRPESRPWVVLVTGVNGVGKTTTVGRLAARHRAEGRRVLVVAADTFRAAAGDQLAIWAERAGADLVRQGAGADPAAVVFDGIRAARARDIDVVLVDTAGRLHTRSNLMAELAKLRRVLAREIDGAPHETLLVLDATTGQNAVSQARVFTEALAATGVVLTKLDGTARGGVVLAVRRELGLPVQWVGVGEGVEDLRPFDVDEFVRALL